VRSLIADADVLIENFKPGTLESWGLDWPALSAANPGLIMLRVSGFGQNGPYKDKAGFGVVAEAMGGLRHLTGEPGQIPVRTGVAMGDTLAALNRARGMIEHIRTEDGFEMDIPGVVPKLSVTPGGHRFPAPQLGADTAQVLRALGLSEAELAALKAKQVIGC
jgi:crotonobetainyl-CoA:carnitine CoA-transferase CaiB-like acyl-CoA transferase